MIPRLYAAGTMAFTNEGLGALSDCMACETSTGINGVPELRITYPTFGVHAGEIGERCVIVADRDRREHAQPYVVQTIDKSTPGVMEIYAIHQVVSIVDGVALEPYTAASLASAIAGVYTYATDSAINDVTITTELVGNYEFNHAVPSSVKLAMGGMEGSFIDTYGGEWDFIDDNAILRSKVGADNGVIIRYGKNLKSLNMNADWTGVYSGIYPYWVDGQTGAVTQMTSPVYSLGTFSFYKVLMLDLSDQFESVPTEAQLLAAAQAYAGSNNLTAPKISWDVKMVALRGAPEYEHVALLEQVALGDTVKIYFPDFDVNASARIVSERYDVIREQYSELVVGSVMASLASTIAGQAEAVNKAVKTVKTTVADAIRAATEAITGNTGGYVVTILNANNEPQELLVMDTPDITTAQNVWRWNASGLGFSGTGYSGPYTTAITSDGKIVADMITAGTLDGSVIQAGTVYFDQLAEDTVGYITGEVDGLKTKVEKQIGDLNTALSSQITHTADNLTIDFNKKVGDVEDVVDANNDAINELNSHIVIGQDEQGHSYMQFLVDGSVYELEINNEGITIRGEGGEPVAVFAATGVELPQETVIPVNGTLQMGNFKWMPRTSGNLSLVRI